MDGQIWRDMNNLGNNVTFICYSDVAEAQTKFCNKGVTLIYDPITLKSMGIILDPANIQKCRLTFLHYRVLSLKFGQETVQTKP